MAQLRSLTRLRLVLLDQIADALRVFLAVAVANDGIGAAGGLDDDFRPEDAGRDVHRCDLRHRDALFVRAEQARLYAADALRADDEFGGEEQVALRPSAGGERLSGSSVERNIGHV